MKNACKILFGNTDGRTRHTWKDIKMDVAQAV
jgi:hypothetical protein